MTFQNIEDITYLAKLQHKVFFVFGLKRMYKLRDIAIFPEHGINQLSLPLTFYVTQKNKQIVHIRREILNV